MPRERILPPPKNLVSPGKTEEESPLDYSNSRSTVACLSTTERRVNPITSDAASTGAEPTGTSGATYRRRRPACPATAAGSYEDAPPGPCEVSMRPAPPSSPPLGRPEAEEVAAGANNPPAARAGARALTRPSTMPLTSGAGAGEEAACGCSGVCGDCEGGTRECDGRGVEA